MYDFKQQVQQGQSQLIVIIAQQSHTFTSFILFTMYKSVV